MRNLQNNSPILVAALFFATPIFAMEKQKEDVGTKMITYSQLTANRVHSLLKANDFEGYFALLDQFDAETQKYLGELEFDGGKAIHWAAYRGNSEALKKLLQRGTPVETSNNERRTALHIAAYNNQCKIIAILVKDFGACLQARDTRWNDTPLHLAVRGGRIDAIRTLKELGHDLEVRNKDTYTPFILAAYIGQIEALKVLKELGAHIEARAKIIDQSAFHIAAGIAAGWKRDAGLKQIEVLKVLKELGADIEATDWSGETPFVSATRFENDAALKVLRELGANIRAQSRSGLTALHIAVRIRSIQTIRLLLEMGLDINVRGISQNLPCEKNQQTPLHEAAEWGPEDFVSFLVTMGADIKACDSAGDTPLHNAAMRGRSNVMKTLRELGADIYARNNAHNTPLDVDKICCLQGILRLEDIKGLHSKRKNGFTLLMLAAKRGFTIIIEKLLTDNRLDPNLQNDDGETALHVAAKFGTVDVARLLLQDKRTDAYAQDKLANTPLHFAAIHNKPDMAKLLLSRDKYHDLRLNKAGQSARQLADRYPEVRNVFASMDPLESSMLIEEESTLSEFKQSSPESTKTEEKSEISLHLAAQMGNVEFVARLLELGANPYARNLFGQTALDTDKAQCIPALLRLQDMQGPNSKRQNGNTLLMDAAHQNHACIVQDLLANERLDVSAKNNDGETALHIAAKAGNLDSIHLLLQDRRTDKYAQDKDGNTPLHVAAQNGKIEAVGLFLLHDRLHASRLNKAGKTARELGDLAVQRLFDRMDQIHAFFAFWKAQPKHMHSLPTDLHQQLIGYLHYALPTK